MVAVVMPVYQGEAFLAPQVESILGQSYSDIRLYIRDDGSRDNSLKIIRDYARKDVRVVLVSDNMGQHGVTGSIKSLLAKVQEDVVFFADQDDVWHRDKLEIMIKYMPDGSSGSFPAVVFSDLEVVDADLNVISKSFWKVSGIDPQRISFKDVLKRNCVTGCACAINRRMLELMIKIPDKAVHDWWCACLAAKLGKLVPVPFPLVKYRQHALNVIGVQDTGLRKINSLTKDPYFRNKFIKQQGRALTHLKLLLEDEVLDLSFSEKLSIKKDIFFRKLIKAPFKFSWH